MELNHEGIADHINKSLDINIFDNIRTIKHVDARSLYCFILRNDLKYTLYTIRDILKGYGKNYDHSTVHYNVKLFEEVRKRRPEINHLRDQILMGISSKFLLETIVSNIETEEQANEILKCITY